MRLERNFIVFDKAKDVDPAMTFQLHFCMQIPARNPSCAQGGWYKNVQGAVFAMAKKKKKGRKIPLTGEWIDWHKQGKQMNYSYMHTPGGFKNAK